jgi:hypothetical protein
MTHFNYSEFGKVLVKNFSLPRMKWIAELTSSSSDSPIRNFSLKTQGSIEEIAALLAISYVTDERDGFARKQYLEKVAQKGARYNWEGNWKIVKEIIFNKVFTPHTVIQNLLKYYSTNTIFGNLIPIARRLMRTFRIYDPYLQPKGKVKKTQRKRGYDDKGSLRPTHKWRETHYWSGPNPEKVEHGLEIKPHSAGWLGNHNSRRKPKWADILQNLNKLR